MYSKSEILEIKNNFDSEPYKYYSEACEILANEAYAWTAFEIVDEDGLNYIIENRLKNSGYAGVKCLLADVTTFNDEYFKIDAYGNASDLNNDDISELLQEIADNLEDGDNE